MSRPKTVLMASFMKHAAAMGKDPFDTGPITAPDVLPGSIEAKRQEQGGEEAAQAEADLGRFLTYLLLHWPMIWA